MEIMQEIEEYIPEPRIIMLGCRPWPPTAAEGEGEACPVCGQGIQRGDDHLYCGCCDSMSPRREAEIRAARLGLKGKGNVEAAERRAREELRAAHPTVLTERERRRVWHGSRTAFDTDAEVANRAATGRAWLASIGQEPDFSIVLTSRRHGAAG